MKQNSSVSVEIKIAGVPGILCKLPVFHPVVAKLLRIISDDEVEIASVIDLLQSDPGLSGEILVVANSPLYGFTSTIRNIAHAVVVLGLERVKKLTMTVAMGAFFKAAASTKPVHDCWRHSLAAALVAEEVAPLFGVVPSHAYTCALLHDIGRAGLLAAYPREYLPLLTARHGSVAELLAIERKNFDLDHCKAGLWLTRAWGFPEEFWATAAHHHDNRLEEKSVVSLARFSCLMARAFGFESVRCDDKPTAENVLNELPPQLRRRFHYDLANLESKTEAVIHSLAVPVH